MSTSSLTSGLQEDHLTKTAWLQQRVRELEGHLQDAFQKVQDLEEEVVNVRHDAYQDGYSEGFEAGRDS